MAALALAGVAVGAVTSYANPAKAAEANLMKQESCKKTPQTEQGYYTCPPGNYLGHTAADQEERNSRLRSLHEKLRAKGYVHNDRETSNSYETRGFATYESSMWLKPEECLTLPDETWSAENGGYLNYKEDNSPTYITKVRHAPRLDCYCPLPTRSTSPDAHKHGPTSPAHPPRRTLRLSDD